MTIRVEETYDSREVFGSFQSNQRTLSLEFVVWDDSTPPANTDPITLGEAVRAVLQQEPYGDPLPEFELHLQTISVKELTKFAAIATAKYGVYEPPESGQIKFGFSTAGDSETITHSMATIATYAATGQLTRNHGLAINVTENGIQGTKRGFGKLKFWVNAYFDPAVWNAETWLTMTELCYTTNLEEWHGWPAGYVLFEHCESSEVVLNSGELVAVKFYFSARAPENVDKGNGIEFTKPPWAFVWDTTAGIVSGGQKCHTIVQTNLEQIYASSDFALLGLGT